MEVNVFRHLWGLLPLDHGSAELAAAVPRLGAAGYRGVVYPTALVADDERQGWFDTLRRHDLALIDLIYTTGADYDEHLASFRSQAQRLAGGPQRFVIAQAGQDAFDDDDAARFVAETLTIAADLDLVLAHETHRRRILYNPWRTARLLERFDDLRLVCDYSHWVVVCERLLDDLDDILAMCATRALHVDARVGHAQGPQVADPRLPAFAAELAAHERWWHAIWDAQEAAGFDVATVTPEFGPPPYLPVHPVTGTPLADLVEVCDWMAARVRTTFAERNHANLTAVSGE